MSPIPSLRAENAIFVPSGLNAGDSGSSTAVSLILYSVFRLTTFWMMSVLSFSVRTKYAMPIADRRPGDPGHDVAAQTAGRRDVLEPAVLVEARASGSG